MTPEVEALYALCCRLLSTAMSSFILWRRNCLVWISYLRLTAWFFRWDLNQSWLMLSDWNGLGGEDKGWFVGLNSSVLFEGSGWDIETFSMESLRKNELRWRKGVFQVPVCSDETIWSCYGVDLKRWRSRWGGRNMCLLVGEDLNTCLFLSTCGSAWSRSGFVGLGFRPISSFLYCPFVCGLDVVMCNRASVLYFLDFGLL